VRRKVNVQISLFFSCLITRYHKLKSLEEADVSSKADQDSIDLYYSKIHDMCQKLWAELELERDEL
jgi:hypothetical protein